MFHKPTWVKETQSASAMMTRSHGICKHGWYCVRLWVPMALRIMPTASPTSVSTCKYKDHIQAQHHKHTMWLPRKKVFVTSVVEKTRWTTTDTTFIYAFISFVQIAYDYPTHWRTIAPSLTTGCLHTHTKPLLSVHFPATTQKSAQHQQDMHSTHTTAHDVTRCAHVASFLEFLFLLLSVSSSCFRFPNPLWLGFYAPKGSPIRERYW